jgi:hypothetical protein
MTAALQIFQRPRYFSVTTLVAIAMIVFAAWLPNLHLITKTMTSQSMTLWQKTNLLTALLGSLRTNFTPFTLGLTVVSAILTGLQVSLMVFYLHRSARMQAEMGASTAGIVTSLFGIGCASCGSVLLTSLIGFGSATTLIGVLPFRGQEFGLLGIAILLVTLGLTVRKINQPYVCRGAT